jgi:hypothetical protein
MGAASVVAAIGFGGAVFMLWFLLALLREGAPSVCCWVVPVRRKPPREAFQVLSIAYEGGDCCETGTNRSELRVELLENENREKGKYGSSPITLDGRIISGRLGRRAIHPKHSYVLRERRL